MATALQRVGGILAVGEAERPEFSGLGSYWTQHSSHWQQIARPNDATDVAPHGILLLWSRPDQFSSASITRLRRDFPLARIISIEGAWSAGAGRTTQPPSGIERMAWHQWPYRLTRRLQLPAERLLPITSTGVEQILAERPIKAEVQAGTTVPEILISAPQYDDFEHLAACCLSFGYQPVWLEGEAGGGVKTYTVALWVGCRLHPSPGRDPAEFARMAGSSRLIWSLESVQVGDFDLVAVWGDSTIISRPMLLRDLEFVLNYPIPLAVRADLGAIPR